jgi:uncharacterized membrane protein YbhN (UPF0104 family)
MIQKYKRGIILLAKVIISTTIIFFIVWYIKTNINSLKNFDFQINYVYLSVSFIILIFYILNQFFLWYYITIQNKCSIDLRTTVLSRNYSSFGKYVPGKVYGYAMLMYAYAKANQSKTLVSFSMFLELLVSVLASAFIFLLSLFFIDIQEFQKYRIITLILLLFFFILLNPKILNYFTDWFLKVAKREPVKWALSYSQLIKIILLYILNFLLFGVAFILFIRSIYSVSFSNYLFITGTTAAAGLIGLFAIFVPAGLGVREGVLVFTLSFVMPPAIAGIIALTSRLWMTFAEIFLFGLILGISKTKCKENESILQ